MPSADGYTEYAQHHTFDTSSGTVVAPSANRTGSARLLRLHGAYGSRTMSFNATRVGTPPTVPAPGDTDGDLFVSGTVVNALPTPNRKDGTFTFTVSGSYLYLQTPLRVPGVDPIPSGVYPFPLDGQDLGAYAQLYATGGLAGAAADDNTSRAVTLLAAASYDDDNPDNEWFLTSLPPQSFQSYTVLG